MILQIDYPKITLIIPFRNRSSNRLKKNLDSLKRQTSKKYKVVLIDYGSTKDYSQGIEKLISNYTFVNYYYQDTSMLPWSRAHALNIGVKKCNTSYFFPVDVDLIFDKGFLEVLYACIAPNKITTFKVGFLKKRNSEWSNPEKMKIEQISPDTALGMTLFKKKEFENIGGYDEKYVYWGGEDNDIVARFKKEGYTHCFYSGKEILYHQWHPRYEMQQETFPMGIKSFLLNSNIRNIFQQDRKRGEILYYKKDNFEIFKIPAKRFQMIWEIEETMKTTHEKLICFLIGPTKRKYRYNKGKQYLLYKSFNTFFKTKKLKIEWSYDQEIYKNYEVRDQILSYAISKRSEIDLVGLEVLEKKVQVYLRILANNEA